MGVVTALVFAALLGGSARAASPPVAALQVALRQQGLYSGPVDGIQGPATQAALRNFQSRHLLVADGVVGPATSLALHAIALGSRTLAQGATGWDVSQLQFELRSRGLLDLVDGAFGPATTTAVRRAQALTHQSQDGIAGPTTLRALQETVLQRPAQGPTLRPFSALHPGIDIEGTQVRAAAAGVVASVGVIPGYGLTVVLDHGAGLRTRYALLTSTTAAPGMAVAAGEMIGQTAGRLHFELTENGVYEDPETALISGDAALRMPRSIASTR